MSGAASRLNPADIAACAESIRQGDGDRFLAAMSTPAPLRAPLFVLSALNVEIGRAAWASKETHIAQMRLQFWRDVIAGAATPEGRIYDHPVARPLAVLIAEKSLSCAALDGMVTARWWDLNRAPFENAEGFRTHLDHTSGALMWLSARCLGAPTAAERDVRILGQAQGLAHWFQAVRRLEAENRHPLVDPRPQAIAQVAGDAARDIKAARQRLVYDFGKKAQFYNALRAAWLAESLLRQVARRPECVARGGPEVSGFSKRLGLMRRAFYGGF